MGLLHNLVQDNEDFKTWKDRMEAQAQALQDKVAGLEAELQKSFWTKIAQKVKKDS